MTQTELQRLNNTMWDKFQAYRIINNPHVTSLCGKALIDASTIAWKEYCNAANNYQVARRDMGLLYLIVQTGKG
jgi:hypothetical protein